MQKRVFTISIKFVITLFLVITCVSTIYAQIGSSSASVSRSRDNADSGSGSGSAPKNNSSNNYNNSTYNPPSQNSQYRTNNYNYNPGYNAVVLRSSEIRIEEFINYHKHQLPLPKVGQAVALDVRWGNEQVSLSNTNAVLQIGFSTASVNDKQDLPPVNLAIVIDRSGSMAGDLKLEKVKTALLAFLKQLKDQDVLSLIVYDTGAQVILPARRVTSHNKHEISNIISRIYPAGSTNLHAGLMLGYQEVLKNYQENATNRVILLTDGIANEGVTDPNQIIRESRGFNNRGVDVSTIGVGKDINEDLLRQLAKSGRGLYHFVANADDINKVFVKESESLVALLAQRVKVNIEYDPALQLEKIYGYEPKYRENAVTVTLDNMNFGVTQVVMMEFSLKAGKNVSEKYFPVKVDLYYDDVERKETVIKSERTFIQVTEKKAINSLLDNEVKKNFAIACLAQAIKDMAVAYEQHNYERASYIINTAITQAYNSYPTMKDKDINYILDILKDYQRNLGLNNTNRETTYGDE